MRESRHRCLRRPSRLRFQERLHAYDALVQRGRKEEILRERRILCSTKRSARSSLARLKITYGVCRRLCTPSSMKRMLAARKRTMAITARMYAQLTVKPCGKTKAPKIDTPIREKTTKSKTPKLLNQRRATRHSQQSPRINPAMMNVKVGCPTRSAT